jgi:hypothetical protein
LFGGVGGARHALFSGEGALFPLADVGGLVQQPRHALDGVEVEHPGAEEDVVLLGEGLGVDRLRGPGGGGVVVNPHLGDVAAQGGGDTLLDGLGQGPTLARRELKILRQRTPAQGGLIVPVGAQGAGEHGGVGQGGGELLGVAGVGLGAHQRLAQGEVSDSLMQLTHPGPGPIDEG